MDGVDWQVDHRGVVLEAPPKDAGSLQVLSLGPDGLALLWDLRNDPKENPTPPPIKALHLVWKPYLKVCTRLLPSAPIRHFDPAEGAALLPGLPLLVQNSRAVGDTDGSRPPPTAPR
jgi:hypothetical protein